jgi:hypothetical protein
VRGWSDEAGSETTSVAILVAMAAVLGLAVLGSLGYHLWQYFQHLGQCLNGC